MAWMKETGILDPVKALEAIDGLDHILNDRDRALVLNDLQRVVDGDYDLDGKRVEQLLDDHSLDYSPAVDAIEFKPAPVEYFDISELTGKGKQLRKYILDRKDWVYPLHPDHPDGQWTAESPVPSVHFADLALLRWQNAAGMLDAFRDAAGNGRGREVAMRVASYANATDGTNIRPADATIADEVGLTRVSVNTIRQRLRAHGWFTKTGEHPSGKGRPIVIERLSVPCLVAPTGLAA